MEKIDKIEQIYEEAGIADGGRLSEADTCDRIILRLLREVAGYYYTDCSSQVSDTARGRPDYTILPGTDYTWYLEAKAWSAPLSDNEAAQAVSYVNNKGARWAVLTNGTEWRLYDNNIKDKPAHERLQAKAVYTKLEELERFLKAISRESMKNGEIEKYAARESLLQSLQEQIVEPGSNVVKAIATALNQNTDESRKLIVDFFRKLKQPLSRKVSSSAVSHPSNDMAESVYNLNSIPVNRLSHSRPEAVILDSNQKIVRTWNALLCEIIHWIAESGQMPPLPYRHGGRILINDSESQMTTSKRIPLSSGNAIFIETNSSAASIVQQLKELCSRSKIDLERVQIKVHLRE